MMELGLTITYDRRCSIDFFFFFFLLKVLDKVHCCCTYHIHSNLRGKCNMGLLFHRRACNFNSLSFLKGRGFALFPYPFV